MMINLVKQTSNRKPQPPSPDNQELTQSQLKRKRRKETPKSTNTQSPENNKRTRQDDATINIRLSGLSISTTNEDLKEHFEKIGAVRKAEVKREFTTGRSLGYGVLRMADLASQKQVLKNREHNICQQVVTLKGMASERELEAETF